MELFKITEAHDVELNKEWVILIPEFKALLDADKDKKKQKARSQLGYIYFVVDFKSPIQDWEFSEKHEEALKYSGLTEKDVSNSLVTEARNKYEELQHKAARALRTLENAKKGLDALDAYLADVDFKATDKQGKLLHSPKEFAANITQLNKMYDELDKFEKRVREQLKESTTIRGAASLGDKEHKRAGTETWNEESGQDKTGVRFDDLAVILNETKQQDKEAKENLEQ